MTAAAIAIGLSGVACLIWLGLFVRTVRSERRDHRFVPLVGPLLGFLASVGSLSSAIGYLAMLSPELDISPELLTLVASVGRGALLALGLVALIYYQPAKSGPR